MRILVGLGNPGEDYEKTRHNIGFYCLDRVAEEIGAGEWKAFKGGLLAKAGERLLFKPMQFMNRSGLPVRQAVDFYQITPEEICVLADDVYVAPGSVRMRHSGGDGGHNGLKSLLDHLPSPEFWRVRIGVGTYEQHPEKRQHQPALDDYVLQPLAAHDRKKAEEAIDRVVPHLIEWLEHGTLSEETVHI